MAIVHFYEKPGCVTNAKQKQLLTTSGHEVIAHNLLETPWTADELRNYFGERPVHEWFNTSAPRIKSGAVVPEQLDTEHALRLMIADPLLIRRPLLRSGERCEVGFDPVVIQSWLGLVDPARGKDSMTWEQRPHTARQTDPSLSMS